MNRRRFEQELVRLSVFLSLVLVAGCKSHPLGPYISPRVEGQVVDAAGRPLQHVKVIRGQPALNAIGNPPKGGQLLMAKAPEETNRQGHFTLPSERVLSIVRGSGWNEVKLTFLKPGFDAVKTNIPTKLAAISERGEPVLHIGLVQLRPAE